MWRELDLTMTFTTPLCGGVPRDPEIIDRWVDTRTATEAAHKRMLADDKKEAKEAEAIETEERRELGLAPVSTILSNAGCRTLEEIRQDRQDTVDPLEEVSEQDKVWVGFSRDETGLFVRGANLRAHLKDCAGVVGPHAKTGKVPDMPTVLNFRAKAVNAIYIKEDRLHILNGTGAVAKEATAFRDATLSVMTAQGPRTCLKRVDYIEPAVIKATILLYPGEITRDWIEVLLDYGCVHGFGQDRSLQFGRYKYELGE